MSNMKELLKAAKILGIRGVNNQTPEDEVRRKVNEKLGNPETGIAGFDGQAEVDARTDAFAATVVKHGEEAIASQTGAVTARANNIPNLSPTGQWEGKRARIRRVKTGHNDMNGAIFNWNGWPCIVPIDEDVDIAWPILGIIQQCTGMQMEITQDEDPRDAARVHNTKHITYYDKYPFQYKGVTPGTEHLPESPWEYTLDMYVEEFPKYTVRMWRQLCVLWEISDKQAGVVPGIGPEEEMKLRNNAIHFALNIPQGADRPMRFRVRNEKRGDIGMEAKAA